MCLEKYRFLLGTEVPGFRVLVFSNDYMVEMSVR